MAALSLSIGELADDKHSTAADAAGDPSMNVNAPKAKDIALAAIACMQHDTTPRQETLVQEGKRMIERVTGKSPDPTAYATRLLRVVDAVLSGRDDDDAVQAWQRVMLSQPALAREFNALREAYIGQHPEADIVHIAGVPEAPVKQAAAPRVKVADLESQIAELREQIAALTAATAKPARTRTAK